MYGHSGITLRVPSAATSSSAVRASTPATPLPSYSGSTSVCVNTISSSVRWYAANPASSPSIRASHRSSSSLRVTTTSPFASLTRPPPSASLTRPPPCATLSPAEPEPLRQGRAVAAHRIEEDDQLPLPVPEVALHDGVDPLEVTQHDLTTGAVVHHPRQAGQQRADHPVVLLEPLDHHAQLGVLAAQPGEQRGILVAVVRPQRRADGPAAQDQVVAQGCRAHRGVEPVTRVVEHGADPVVQPAQLRAQRHDPARGPRLGPSSGPRLGPSSGPRRGGTPNTMLPDRHPPTVGARRPPGNP